MIHLATLPDERVDGHPNYWMTIQLYERGGDIVATVQVHDGCEVAGEHQADTVAELRTWAQGLLQRLTTDPPYGWGGKPTGPPT